MINLAPTMKQGRMAPIVLIGGVNGGGKTTLLDAVQLLLYGNRAPCSSRSEKNYDDFLRESIHHGVDLTEGAGVKLSFSYVSEGREHDYEVSRSWSVIGDRIREQVAVLKDGTSENWMASNWNQLVEDLIPLGISQLCFFDAEKIRFISDDDQRVLHLGSAMKSLMGLDLVERLLLDATVLRDRIGKRTENLVDQKELEKLDEALRAKQEDIDDAVQELGGLENLRQATEQMLKKAEQRFAELGGHHWQQRENNQRQQVQLDQELREIENLCVSLVGAELPLALIKGLLEDVWAQSKRETIASENEIVYKLLFRRDQQILDILHRRGVGIDAVNTVREFTDNDRALRSQGINVEKRLALSNTAKRWLDHLLKHTLSEKRAEAQKLVEAYDCCRCYLEELRRTVALTPEDGTAREVANELKKAVAELTSLDQRVNRLEKRLAGLRSEREDLQKQLQRLRSKIIEEEICSEEEARLGRLVTSTQKTMKEFLALSLTRKLDRLSELITESLRYLLRKKQLVQRVQIDPHTLRVNLYDQTGSPIPKQRLSEGEKQILAISVLWAMSRASARPIPTIVDTPMARLDQKHRQRLVQRYLPHASHQVIVLSTDTEVDAHYFEFLKPYTCRAYHLNYDDQERRTTVEEGYFWGPRKGQSSSGIASAKGLGDDQASPTV